MKPAVTAALAGVLLLSLTACNNYATQPDQQAIRQAGGPLSDPKIEACYPPGQKGRDGVFEDFFYYPVSQRSWSATGTEDSESNPFVVVSKDNAEMRVPMTVTFTLTTDCDKLKAFHTKLGNRFGAYMSGADADVSEGWVRMLNFVIGVPVKTNLDRIAQQYTWRSLWNDPSVKADVEHEVEQTLDDAVVQQAGGEFFNFSNVVVLKPEPVDPGLKKAINLEQSAVANADAQKAQAEAEEARARAQIAVARAEAQKRRQEIAGYGSVAEYNKAKAIERGLNPYQPTYVVPQGVTQ